MHRRAFLGTGCSGLGFAVASQVGVAGPAWAAQSKPKLGSFGFDKDGRDLSIQPGDDFWRHGGGTWMTKNPMPADRSSWGAFDALAAQAEVDVRAIIEEVAAKQAQPGSI